MQIIELLELMVDKGASDLHLRVPSPPVLRIDGKLVPQEQFPPIKAEEIEIALEKIITDKQRKAFFENLELDFAYSVPGLARFRVSVLRQRGTLSIAFRLVPVDIPSIDELGLPPILGQLILKPKGLILVTGPSGSGKSTTLAAMIDYLNENERKNVITIEDPIEYLHSNKKCIIAQRDLGDDTRSIAASLIHALRHDPDVIVVGEMRDLATIETAITAAEAGHLVLGTLHTTDACQTIDRMVKIFPPNQQHQIRFQLAQVLEAIISQTLLTRLEGGRIAAFEILIATNIVRETIREGETFQLPSVIESAGEDSMQTLDQALADLVTSHVVSEEEVTSKGIDPERLQKLLPQLDVSQDLERQSALV